MLIIQKFGGSSLADRERLRRAASISREAFRRGNQVVTVVSAPGDATDELLQRAREIDPEPPGRESDALTSTGEQQSAALMAMMLRSMGVPAKSLTGWQAGIVTESRHEQAEICLLLPERVERCLEAGEIAVVAGFQGVDARGDITTLGRGGSDTTAVALAAALEADRCEIYTDVDGIYTADPRLVPDARRLEEIDDRDMLALAEAGSQVLHPPAVAIAMANRVEIRLLSSFEAGPGTVVRRLSDARRPPVAGVTRDAQTHRITVVGRSADGALLVRLTDRLSREGIPPLSVETGEGCLQLEVAPEQLLPALERIHREIFD